MEVVNLLKFMNNAHSLYALDFARCNRSLVNFLDLMVEDEQFTRSIDLGLIYYYRKDADKYVIVDGLSRILSLSLLLHAICECYKKTSSRNDKAIKTIRTKYLFSGGSKLKLHLHGEDADLYSKIINGERLSGYEKSRPMFVLLHNFWSQIKEEKLQASNIFKMLQKINIVLVEAEDISLRDMYYRLNKSNRKINQITLIDDYIAEKGLTKDWEEIKNIFSLEKNDISLFLKDFFITKFNYKMFSNDRLYDSFVNYFETMLQYKKKNVLISDIKRSAVLYANILNVNFKNEDIRHAFINIKRHNGVDTYAYILNVYEDFYMGNISESIFMEILNTIDEYLKNRELSGKNIDFNELVQYLNALISFK